MLPISGGNKQCQMLTIAWVNMLGQADQAAPLWLIFCPMYSYSTTDILYGDIKHLLILNIATESYQTNSVLTVKETLFLQQ